MRTLDNRDVVGALSPSILGGKIGPSRGVFSVAIQCPEVFLRFVIPYSDSRDSFWVRPG